MIARVLTFCFSLLLAGCATYDYEGAAHFRALRNNTPVFVTVTDDLDRTSRRVRLARNHLGEEEFESTVDVEPGPNPFMPDKVLTMCPEQGVNHVTG